MTEVEFEDGSGGDTASLLLKKRQEYQPSFFVRWLLKIGIIKDSNQAIYVFLVIAFICILGTVIIFYKSYQQGPFRHQSPYVPPPQTK